MYSTVHGSFGMSWGAIITAPGWAPCSVDGWDTWLVEPGVWARATNR